MKNLEKCKCENTAVYELLRTDMVGGPAQVFTRYHGDVMPCGKDTLAVNKKPYDQKQIAKFSKDVLKGKVFWVCAG